MRHCFWFKKKSVYLSRDTIEFINISINNSNIYLGVYIICIHRRRWRRRRRKKKRYARHWTSYDIHFLALYDSGFFRKKCCITCYLFHIHIVIAVIAIAFSFATLHSLFLKVSHLIQLCFHYNKRETCTFFFIKRYNSKSCCVGDGDYNACDDSENVGNIKVGIKWCHQLQLVAYEISTQKMQCKQTKKERKHRKHRIALSCFVTVYIFSLHKHEVNHLPIPRYDHTCCKVFIVHSLK